MGKVLLLVLVLVPASLAVKYNYRANDKDYGPSVWNTKYSTHCAGKRQSPIDIETKKTVYKDFGALKFTNIETVPSGPSLGIGNNKYGLRVYLKKDYFTVEGGGLPGKFNMFSFHFHWGNDSSRGSEHLIDGKKYPAELHFVNWNMKYDNISVALNHEDGIAAIGVLLKIGNENAALSSFLKYAANLTLPEELKDISQTHPIANLMPNNRDAFHRYNGSLTTPTCQEVVTWTVFNNTMTITENQLTLLRSLKDNVTLGVPLVDTHRQPQPLHGRTVYRTFDKPPTMSPPTTTGGTTTVPTAFLLGVMLTLGLFFN